MPKHSIRKKVVAADAFSVGSGATVASVPGAGDAVLVAVRVRPFSDRERQRHSRLVIGMPDQRTTAIWDPTSTEGTSAAATKFFTFDYSYWSHDGFNTEADGRLVAREGCRYADQRKVFDDLGRCILDNAWKGYNCSLFAYGQTGSGKSYSVVGFRNNKAHLAQSILGIVPMVCEELFRRIESARWRQLQHAEKPHNNGDGNKSGGWAADDKNSVDETPDEGKPSEKLPQIEYLVTISMLEIYWEKVRDLLNTAAVVAGNGGGKVGGGGGGAVYCRVRENPKAGFYVEGLSSHVVESYPEIERKIREGTRNRTIAATNLNETSSRAHTIVKLTFIQKCLNVDELSAAIAGGRGNGTTKISEINLVDLAGSERQKKSGSEGDRLKEGILINKSLSVLGRVIKALNERQQSHRSAANIQIPYRDSILTSLLKNALGGNSKTIMLATISPSDHNYDETLSTLRFADRVKAIRTRPIVNESPTERMLRELRDENARLQAMIQRGAAAIHETSAATREELENLKRQLAENQREMSNLERSWSMRLAEETRKQLQSTQLVVADSKAAAKRRSDETPTHTTDEQHTNNNYNDQQDLDELLERLRAEKPHLWNLNEDPALTDVITHFIEVGENRIGSGPGDGHTPHIQLKGLSICDEHALLINRDNRRIVLRALGNAEILVNGRPLSGDAELQQNDRIHFGGNHLYVFTNPLRAGAKRTPQIDFGMAQREIARHLGAAIQLDNTSGGGGGTSIALFQTDDTLPTTMMPPLMADVSPLSPMPYGFGQQQRHHHQQQHQDELALEEEFIRILPNVNRANEMARELERKVRFEIVLLPPERRGLPPGPTEICVKVHDTGEDTTFLWDADRFMSRYYGMEELYRSYLDGVNGPSSRNNWNPPKDRDPFHESADTPIVVGVAHVVLERLAYMLELDDQFPVVDMYGGGGVDDEGESGGGSGQLFVAITPCNPSGKEILGEFVEDPMELVDKNLAFKVKILSALGLPRRIEQSYCTYRFFDRAESSTVKVAGSNPPYAHEQLFTFRPIAKEFIDYLTTGALDIVVRGTQRSRDMTLHAPTTQSRISAYLSQKNSNGPPMESGVMRKPANVYVSTTTNSTIGPTSTNQGGGNNNHNSPNKFNETTALNRPARGGTVPLYSRSPGVERQPKHKAIAVATTRRQPKKKKNVTGNNGGDSTSPTAIARRHRSAGRRGVESSARPHLGEKETSGDLGATSERRRSAAASTSASRRRANAQSVEQPLRRI